MTVGRRCDGGTVAWQTNADVNSSRVNAVDCRASAMMRDGQADDADEQNVNGTNLASSSFPLSGNVVGWILYYRVFSRSFVVVYPYPTTVEIHLSDSHVCLTDNYKSGHNKWIATCIPVTNQLKL